jgi:hypothetical protein
MAMFGAVLQGRVVSFKNAIIIMTSNLGSAEIFNHTYKAQQHKAAAQEAGARGAEGCNVTSATTGCLLFDYCWQRHTAVTPSLLLL